MSLFVADKLRKLLESRPEAVERGVIVGREARNVVIVKTSHGVVRAVNTTVASRAGIPVVIAKIRQEWVVIGLDYFAYFDPPSYHTVPYHAEAHVMGHPDGSDDLVFLPKVQYLPLAVVPTSPPTQQVRICAGTFINLDGRIMESDERRFDFSSIIDGLSAGTNVLLGINRESGLAEVIMPDQAGGITVPIAFIPLALVKLRPNQTEVTWKEIVDVRELPSSRSGLSSLSELGDACVTNPLDGDHLVWDEGTGCWTNEPNTLVNLRDVNISSPADDHILTWDSINGKWINVPNPVSTIALDDLVDVSASSPQEADIISWDNNAGLWRNGPLPAIVSIDGVSNPGGNVDLVAGTGLTITPDNVNKSVTIGADLNYLDSRYVNADGDTITGTLIASRFAQSPGSFGFLGGDSIDPYLRAEDIVFDVLQGRPPTSAEQWNGTEWATIDASAFRDLFRGGGFWGVYAMTNGSGAIRLTWNNMPYSFFQKLVVYCSTHGNGLSIKCETSADGTTWTEQFTTPAHYTWPGWIMRHGFFSNYGQTPYFRLTFTPTWGTTNPIYLLYVRYFCTLNIVEKLTPFSWDVDRVVSFVQTPKVGDSAIWHAGNDGAGSGLDADMLDGKHASAFVTGQGAGVRRTTAQSIPSGPWIPVSFDTVDWDSDGCWSPGEPTRLYCRTAGVYVISATVQWEINGNGTRGVELSHNGVTVRGAYLPDPPVTVAPRLDINDILSMSSGDFIELIVYQTSGDYLDLLPYNGRYIKLAMARIG